MDIFRLPPAVRRSIISRINLSSHRHRPISILTHSNDAPLNPEHPSFAPDHTSLSTSNLNAYMISTPPNTAQLRYSSRYFTAAPPTFLYSAAYFRSFPPSVFPEVAFLGRSNVGKSSLLNALFGRTRRQDARVSRRPGMTKTMNGFGVHGPDNPLGAAPKVKSIVRSSGSKKVTQKQTYAMWTRFPIRGGLVVVDMPGYGAGSRPEWGHETLKYLANRKQLRRTFVLIDAEHGLKRSDEEILTHLRRSGIPYQLILSKVDKLVHPDSRFPSPAKIAKGLASLKDLQGQIRERLNDAPGDGPVRDYVGDILCCSAERRIEVEGTSRPIGIDEVRWAVLTACGLESDIQGQHKARRSLQNVRISTG